MSTQETVPAIMTRKEAKAASLHKYFTGKPCKRGHYSERYTATWNCMECSGEQAAQWRRDNPEKTKEIQRASVEKGREKYLASRRLYYLNNKETIAAKGKEYRRKNPLVSRASVHRRRARKRASAGSHSQNDVAALLIAQKHKCANCFTGIKKCFEVDHVMPLALGGTNDVSNIQLLCPLCNRRKWAKTPERWAAENGRLI